MLLVFPLQRSRTNVQVTKIHPSQYNPGLYATTRCSFNFKLIVTDQEKVILFYTKFTWKSQEKQKRNPSTDSDVQYPDETVAKMPLIKKKIVAVYHGSEIQESVILGIRYPVFFSITWMHTSYMTRVEKVDGPAYEEKSYHSLHTRELALVETFYKVKQKPTNGY